MLNTLTRTHAWARAVNANTVDAYDRYLTQFPQAPNIEEARALRQTRNEESAWTAVSQSASPQRLAQFLRDFPQSRFRPAAQAQLELVQDSEATIKASLARVTGFGSYRALKNAEFWKRLAKSGRNLPGIKREFETITSVKIFVDHFPEAILTGGPQMLGDGRMQIGSNRFTIEYRADELKLDESQLNQIGIIFFQKDDEIQLGWRPVRFVPGDFTPAQAPRRIPIVKTSQSQPVDWTKFNQLDGESTRAMVGRLKFRPVSLRQDGFLLQARFPDGLIIAPDDLFPTQRVSALDLVTDSGQSFSLDLASDDCSDGRILTRKFGTVIISTRYGTGLAGLSSMYLLTETQSTAIQNHITQSATVTPPDTVSPP